MTITCIHVCMSSIKMTAKQNHKKNDAWNIKTLLSKRVVTRKRKIQHRLQRTERHKRTQRTRVTAMSGRDSMLLQSAATSPILSIMALMCFVGPVKMEVPVSTTNWHCRNDRSRTQRTRTTTCIGTNTNFNKVQSGRICTCQAYEWNSPTQSFVPCSA